MICSSCKNGFNGRNGNGYQPCSCRQANRMKVVNDFHTFAGERLVVKMPDVDYLVKQSVRDGEVSLPFQEWFDISKPEDCGDKELAVLRAWAKLVWDYKDKQILKMMPKGV